MGLLFSGHSESGRETRPPNTSPIPCCSQGTAFWMGLASPPRSYPLPSTNPFWVDLGTVKEKNICFLQTKKTHGASLLACSSCPAIPQEPIWTHSPKSLLFTGEWTWFILVNLGQVLLPKYLLGGGRLKGWNKGRDGGLHLLPSPASTPPFPLLS